MGFPSGPATPSQSPVPSGLTPASIPNSGTKSASTDASSVDPVRLGVAEEEGADGAAEDAVAGAAAELDAGADATVVLELPVAPPAGAEVPS